MAEGKILIVEDDAEVADRLQAYFRAGGYEVKVTPFGMEALEICRHWVPEVIIQDIRLPDIDGYEVVRRLQESVRTKQIGVVFLTELGSRADRLRGLQLGAVDYITKPYDIEELSLKVKNAIKALRRPQPFDPVTNLLRRDAFACEVLSLIETGEWAALRILLRGIEKFRDFYGFVAGDDLLRAVSLVLNNALNLYEGARGIAGLLGEGDFLLLVPADKVDEIETYLKNKLGRTVGYFFPTGEFASLPTDRQAPPVIEVKMGKAPVKGGIYRSPEEAKSLLRDIEKATEPLETVALVNEDQA